MPNMDPKKCPMPSQDPNVRNKNFKEVALGYTAEMAVNEAKRCLQCKKPACRTGCPVQIDIPAFIAEVAKGDFEAAYQVIAKSSALPAVCGRVCPQENQCEGKCVRGIKGEPVGIGRLERFVADWHRENVHTPAAKPEPNGHKVAVIGAGPSGLTVAGDLAKLGYKVTVYEALHVAGGVLMYGIPEFRLPKDIVQHEVEGLKELGVDIECNMVIGKVLTVDELMNDYGFEAVYIASGAGLPRFMGIPGESLKGVYSANEYLTRVNLMKAYQPGSRTPIMKSRAVAVVGGGNVAMDAARCAKRLGAEQVYIVYRRGMAELPARKEEVEHAEEEGIIFKTLTNPVEVLGDENGCVKGMTCVEMELGEPDASGRRRPIVKEGSEFELDVDTMIMALGTSPNPLIRSTTPGLDTDKHGCIITDGPDGLTSRPFVYAGGDDVFLVGAWNDVLEAAQRIQRNLTAFSCGALTLSAGIGIFDPHYPIRLSAEETAALEEAAKHLPGKNAVALFTPERKAVRDAKGNLLVQPEQGHTYAWDTFRTKVLEEKVGCLQRFFQAYDRSCAGKGETPRGNSMLYNLLALLREAENDRINLARYAYLLARLSPEKNAPDYPLYEQFSHSMMDDWAFDAVQRHQLITAIYIYVYQNRKGGDTDGRME